MRCAEGRRRVLLGMLVVTAGSLGSGQEPPTSGPVDADLRARVAGQREFALDLYSRLADTDPGGKPENIVLSPLSLHLALAMTYGGARGGDGPGV